MVSRTIAVVAFASLSLVACKRSPEPASNVLTQSETWCPDGFEVGPQDTCFAIPDAHDKNTPVLVYLHGMYQGHGSPEEWSVVREATRRGFAVVIPRGKRGYCAWKAELKDHFCWPTEIDDPQPFKAVVAEWDKVLWQVDALLEGGTHKRYVLGFSNGAFFAEYLAAQGLFPAQGYALVNGGALVPPPPKAPKPPAMLLVAAQEDAEQSAKMRDLHEGLGKAGWIHAWCTRPGGHALAAQDVDAALRFFKRDAEAAPKSPGGGFACEPGGKPAAGEPAAKR